MSEHRHKRVVGGRCQGHGLTEVGIHHLSEYHRKDQRGNRIIEPPHHESHQSEEEHKSHIKQTVVAREGTDHTEARYHRIMMFFGIVMTLQILGATISPNSKSAKHAMIPATTIE